MSTQNAPQRHETAQMVRDTHPHTFGALRAACAFLTGVALNVTATVCMVAYSELVRRRETGAVLLWAYARACRERNATQRRLARANLLRSVSARPERTDRRGDRPVTIDITPAIPTIDSLRVWRAAHDDELRRRFDAMAAEAVTKAPWEED